MIAIVQNKDLTETAGEHPELNTGFKPATELLSQLSSEIISESSKRIQTGHLELQVKYYCNGELKKSTVTILETYHKDIRSRATLRKLIQAKATLESQGINGDLVLRSKKGTPLVTVKAQQDIRQNEPQKIEIFNPKTLPQKLAEILAGSDSKAVIIQSKAQLNEIKKFASRLGVEKIIVPEKMLNEIEYDPRMIAMPKPLKIKIADIAEAYRQGSGITNAKNETGLEILEELKFPKAEIQTQSIITDDLAFRKDVVDTVLDRVMADVEHAKKTNSPVRKSLIQLHRSAITIQQMLAAEDTEASPAAIVKPVQKSDLAARYARGVSKQYTLAA